MNYSFDNVCYTLGLEGKLTGHEKPVTLSPRDLKAFRRLCWREFRVFLAVNKQGWFSLSSRKRDVNGLNRFIFDKAQTLSPALWAAMDNAKRNKRGVYSVKQAPKAVIPGTLTDAEEQAWGIDC